jgi:hypothetical protein
VLGTAALIPIVVRVGSQLQERRTIALREEFGPEYERLVNHHGDWRKAESEMLKRRRSRAAVKSGAGRK